MRHGAVPQLHDYLESAAREAPEKIALVFEGTRLSYAEIDARANALAHTLASRGVGRGDRVLVFLENGVEAVVAFWAVLKANAVVSMVSPQTRPDRLAYLLSDCRPAALITHAALAHAFLTPAARCPHLRAVVVAGEPGPGFRLSTAIGWEAALAEGDRRAPPPRRGLDVDLAALVYTSGSTGEPKGVMLTHRNMLSAATSICAYLRNEPDDVILGALPMSFDYGLYQMIMAFRTGARLVLAPPFAYPYHVLRTAERERVTGFPGVPSMFAMMADMESAGDLDLSSVRYVTSTAAALSEKLIRFVRGLFPGARVYSMYGLTECKRCTYLPPEDIDRKPGSVGIAIPNTELWIAGEDGRRLGPGEVGELVIRGATVMKGYWEKPEETARKLRPGPLPGEMVLYTGDQCRLDEEGYLYFVARTDEILKSRGEKVAPKEVEAAITEMDGVREAAVVGVPDEVLGQAVKAFVVPRQGATVTEADVVRHCRRRLEGYKVPKIVAVVPDLPRTASGKVARGALR